MLLYYPYLIMSNLFTKLFILFLSKVIYKFIKLSVHLELTFITTPLRFRDGSARGGRVKPRRDIIESYLDKLFLISLYSFKTVLHFYQIKLGLLLK